ncbi:hypothetical protein KUCAC02_033646 [Chaenocephalus aceratus]|nr:hypothetical protein KUCAC02_033646 [Chaenocephalus aceratus]
MSVCCCRIECPSSRRTTRTGRRVSARQRRPAVCRQCPCCRDDQPPDLHCSLHLEDPIRIHNRSVEEYQLIYHEVVDNMLRYVPDGRLRPYSLGLGRRIKQKLWERTGPSDVHRDKPKYPPAKRAKH